MNSSFDIKKWDYYNNLYRHYSNIENKKYLRKIITKIVYDTLHNVKKIMRKHVISDTTINYFKTKTECKVFDKDDDKSLRKLIVFLILDTIERQNSSPYPFRL